MKPHNFKPILLRCAFPIGLVIAAGTLSVANEIDGGRIDLIGIAQLDGTASDLSGFANSLEDGSPHNRLGGISGIEWVSGTNSFRLISDRGPQDGALEYHCRFHEVDLPISLNSNTPFSAILTKTTLLKDSKGNPFVGLATALKPANNLGHRLDPEAIRIDLEGNVWISDEYGPALIRFDANGSMLNEIIAPSNLRIESPSANPKEEDRHAIGRRSNRGMEGLSISTDGRYLVGLMQSALLQDSFIDRRGDKIGNYCRIIRFDLRTGESKQYVYQMERPENKLHEILAGDKEDFLVLEQDGKPGTVACYKRIFRIQLSSLNEIAQGHSMVGAELPSEVTPVCKSEFLDMLDPKYGLRESMPEKVEGMCWGPQLLDGRHTLVVVTDNDFRTDQATYFYLFAVKF